MAEEPALRKRILDLTTEQFFKLGYSKLTVDEIASSLGISKKTLYKHFATKNDLIRAAVEAKVEWVAAQLNLILTNRQLDFEIRLQQMMTFVGEEMPKTLFSVMQDLWKNAPEIWREIEQFRQEHISKNFLGLLREGVKAGEIRDDINLEVVLLMFLNSIRTIVNPEVLSNLPLSAKDIIYTIIKVLFNGILAHEPEKL